MPDIIPSVQEKVSIFMEIHLIVEKTRQWLQNKSIYNMKK